MKLYILDANYDTLAYLDESESVLWHKKFNDLGECEIYIPCDIEMLSILRKGHYVFRYDDDMFCKIESIEIKTDEQNGDYIVATATDMSKILSGRIVRWNTVFSGTVAQFIKKLIYDNIVVPKDEQGRFHTVRAISNFVFDMTEEEMAEFTDTIEASVNTDDLLQLIITTCKSFDYGFRTSFDIRNKELKFRLYKGVNRTDVNNDNYVEFSNAYANIISSNYKVDDGNYKNVAYVGYKSADKDDDNVYLLSLYDGQEFGEVEPQGEARREIYVDGTSTSREMTFDELQQLFPNVRKDSGSYYSGDIQVATEKDDKITATDYTYLYLIRIIGRNLLAQKVVTEVFTGAVDTIDTYQYKVDYNIGDIVRVINEYGIESDAQVVGIMESEDNESGYVVEPRFQFNSKGE